MIQRNSYGEKVEQAFCVDAMPCRFGEGRRDEKYIYYL